ncbi:MAG: hypothetical protein KIG96_09495 [Treponema sp.]|nr:hypothetical protein [Treponema sp.]
MNKIRSIGYTIDCLLDDNKELREPLKTKLNISEYDLKRICAGRLTLSPTSLRIVSETLKCPFKDLLMTSNTDSYQRKLSCRTSFSNPENCDKILDIIDSFIDIKEAL